ncbi:MAG: hypothetical protein VX528_00080 [Candidatus Latescibacterota bacterium]|nr:hypothetical protein [Candidatus Latescibacterota bacterium]
MAEKGMSYVLRENTFTQEIERLFRSRRRRLQIRSYLNALGDDPLDPEDMLRTLGVDLDHRFDLAYSLYKVFGEVVPGNPDRPYWYAIPAEERRAVTKAALRVIAEMDKPVMFFWLSIDPRPDRFGQKRLSHVGFKFQITPKGETTVVHFITPPPALLANKAAAHLNTKRRSWVIGGAETMDYQAREMNKMHNELVRRGRVLRMNIPGRFRATDLRHDGSVKYMQLRHYDPDSGDMDDNDFRNDPIN